MKIRNAIAALLVLLFCQGWIVGNVSAQGMSPDFSSQPTTAHIAEELQEAWGEGGEVFRNFEEIRKEYPRLYAMRRGSHVHLSRSLERLGEEGLLPMLWALASDDPFQLGYGLGMWRNWRVGLIDAVGSLRDPRSVPILLSIIEGPDPHGATRTAATAALGRLLDEEILARVLEIAKQDEEKRAAIVAGLGSARIEMARRYLLGVVESSEDEELVRSAIRSLGDWANQWAWETSELSARREDGEKGRQEVIAHLVTEYPEFGEAARREALKSLQLAGAARAAAYARARAAGSDDEVKEALWQGLANRLDASPLP